MEDTQQAPQSFKSRCFTTSIFDNQIPPFTYIYYVYPLYFLYFFEIWPQIFIPVTLFDKLGTFPMLYYATRKEEFYAKWIANF